jgi:hypothetical protein
MVESNEFEIKTYTVDLRIMHQSYKTTITFEATTEHRNIIPLSATIRWDTSKTIPTKLSNYPKIWT